MRNVVAAAFVTFAVAAPSAALAAPHVSSVVHLVAAKNGLRYTTTSVHANAGRVELVFSNRSALPHNVRLEQGEREFGGTQTIVDRTTKTVVTLKRGVYHFYCSVPGHEEAGMSGTLTVS